MKRCPARSRSAVSQHPWEGNRAGAAPSATPGAAPASSGKPAYVFTLPLKLQPLLRPPAPQKAISVTMSLPESSDRMCWYENVDELLRAPWKGARS